MAEENTTENNTEIEKQEESIATEEAEVATTEGPSFEDIAKEAGVNADSENETATETPIEEDESDVDQEAEGVPTPKETAPKVKSPWIDLNSVNLQEDLRNLYRKPFWIVVTLLAILILTLFILMFVEYLEDERHKALLGYVSTQHKVPQWYKDPLPEDVKHILDEYHEKREQEMAKLKLEPEDAHAKDPIMGDFYPEVLTNEDVILILEEQNIGPITPRGAEKPEKMNLSGLNMTKINFQYLNNFVQSNLRYSDLSGIKASGLVFRGASLTGAIFVDAVIPGTNFTRAKIDDTNFYGADLRSSNFLGAFAQKSLLSHANLSNCNLNDAIFKLSDLSNAILDGSTAEYGYFEGANFRGASLVGVNFEGAILRGASLVNANLSGANLMGASLEGADLEGANLDGAKLRNADLTMADFNNAQNLTREQIDSSKTQIGIRNIPTYVYPQRKSWNERFKPPQTPY